MSTKLARQIVVNTNPLIMTEFFAKAMQERTSAILEGLYAEFSNSILVDTPNATYETRLDNAVDYILGCVNESGINTLKESITKSSKLFRVKVDDIQYVFESALDEKPLDESINHNDFQNNSLKQLNSILENNSGNVLGFLDTTSAYVTPSDATVLVEVYSSLDKENKTKMINKIVESRNAFHKLLKFAYEIMEKENN